MQIQELQIKFRWYKNWPNYGRLNTTTFWRNSKIKFFYPRKSYSDFERQYLSLCKSYGHSQYVIWSPSECRFRNSKHIFAGSYTFSGIDVWRNFFFTEDLKLLLLNFYSQSCNLNQYLSQIIIFSWICSPIHFTTDCINQLKHISIF